MSTQAMAAPAKQRNGSFAKAVAASARCGVRVVAAVPNPTVFIIDDDEAVRRSLEFALRLEGLSVRSFGSGAELLAEADLPSRGCLVIDHAMPGMNGLELLGQLRDRDVALPAIMISGGTDPRLPDRAAAAGIDRFIRKPLLENELLDGIQAALSFRLCDSL